MADMKQVVNAGKVEMVPLSTADLKQRQIDEAAHAARMALPQEKTQAEIIADLTARIAKLEGAAR